MKKAGIEAVLHSSVLVADVQRSLNFYCGVLGLTQVERPDLGYPGAWLQINSAQQMHLLQLPNPDAGNKRPEHGGRDRHTAFSVTDFEALRASLEQAGVAYTLSRSGRAALFCRDPDGNALEFVSLA